MMATPWKELRSLPRELWVLALAALVNRVGTMGLPFLVLYLTRHLDFSVEKAGMVIGTFGIGTLLIGPVSGWVSDRWGSVRVMILSLFSSGVILLLFPLAKTYPAVLLLTVVWATTTHLFRPASFSCVAEYSPPEQRKAAFALMRLAVNIGMSLGPLIGGFLAQVSFPLLYIVDGVTSLIAGVILSASLAAKHRIIHAEQFRASPMHDSITGSLLGALQDRRMRYILLALLPVQIVFFQHESTMPLYLVRDLHFAESTFGLLFTVNTVLIICLELQLNLLTAKWPHARSLVIGSLLFGLGFGAVAFAGTFWTLALTVAIWTFGEMILFPGMTAYVTEISPANRRGAFMGVHMMGFSVAYVLGPLLGTYALEHHGATVLWLSCLLFGAVSAVLCSRVR